MVVSFPSMFRVLVSDVDFFSLTSSALLLRMRFLLTLGILVVASVLVVRLAGINPEQAARRSCRNLSTMSSG